MAAEAEVAELTRTLADPTTYDDAEKAKDIATRHGAAKDRANTLGTQWERLVEQVEAASERARA